MGIIVEPTAYITWIPKGDIHLKPQIIGSLVPDSTQRVKADTIRNIGKTISATGDTARQTGKENIALADTNRAIGAEIQANGDTRRQVGMRIAMLGDTLRRTYLPVGIFVEPKAYISWVPMGTIHLKSQIIASFVTPWQWQTSAKADTARKVVQANDARADTSLKTTRSNTALADTKRSLYSPFIAALYGDKRHRQ